MRGERGGRFLTPWEAVFLAGLAAVMTAAMVIVPSLLLVLLALLAVGFAVVALWQGGSRVRRLCRERGWSLSSWRRFTLPNPRNGLAVSERQRLLVLATAAFLALSGIFLAVWLTPPGPARQVVGLRLQMLGLALLALGGSYLLGRTLRDVARHRWADQPLAELASSVIFGITLYLGVLLAFSAMGVPGWVVVTLFAGLVSTISIAAGVSVGLAVRPAVEALTRGAATAEPERVIPRATQPEREAMRVVISHGGETAEGETRLAA